MRLALKSMATAAVLAGTLSGCETKVTEISVVCRPGDQPTLPVRWFYTSKVDPSVLKLIPRAIDITLHYTGDEPRAVPAITTYFYRRGGAALRVVSNAKATMPAKGTFTYHVDTGGYDMALVKTGRQPPEEVVFYIEVDGSYFAGLLSAPSCGRYIDGHLEVVAATKVPNLKDKHPLNMGAADWLEVSSHPTAILRTEGAEASTYAYFKEPIGLTETKNATSVPDDVDKQAAEIGVLAATPTFSIEGEPAPTAGTPPSPAQAGKT